MWAPYWYDAVHKSNGFGLSSNSSRKYFSFSQSHKEIFREALPFYLMLRRHAIGHNLLNPGSCNYSEYTSPMAMTRLQDNRNGDILVWVGDRILTRDLAKVSVFDSAVQGGDAVWEGIRVYNGHIFKLEEHLSRLVDSAKAMDFQSIPSLEYIRQAIEHTLAGI